MKNVMKILVIAVVVTLSSSFAQAGATKLNSATINSNSDIELQLTLNQRAVKITDTDGAATITTIYYLLTEGISESLTVETRSWSNFSRRRVDNWAQVQPLMMYAVNKLLNTYQLQLFREAKLSDAASQTEARALFRQKLENARNMRQQMRKLALASNSSPTYQELSTIFAQWISDFSIDHTYIGSLGRESANIKLLSFGGFSKNALFVRDPMLPPKWSVVEGRTVMTADFASVFGAASGPSTNAQPLNDGTPIKKVGLEIDTRLRYTFDESAEDASDYSLRSGCRSKLLKN